MLPRLLALVLALLCLPCLAVDPHLRIDQLHHTAWKAADGAPSDVAALAQTADGMLWIGSTAGLHRFDGVRFEPVDLAPRPLRMPAVTALRVAPDGALWIGFAAGAIVRLKDGRAASFDEGWAPNAEPSRFLFDRDGRLWASATDGLRRLDGQRWQRFGHAEGFDGTDSVKSFVDAQSRLWVDGGEGWFVLPHGREAFEPAPVHLAEIATADALGNVWQVNGAGVLSSPVPASPAATMGHCLIPGAPDGGVQFDRAGVLWMANWGRGLTRVSRLPAAHETTCRFDRYTEKDGLSGDTVESMLEDREGNLWFGTANGLDRFRDGRVVAAPLAGGRDVAALAALDDGGVVAASYVHGASRLSADGAAVAIGQQGFMGMMTAYRGPRGEVWIGASNALWRLQGAGLEKVALPPELAAAGVSSAVALVGDGAGALWVDFKPGGLFRRVGQAWTRVPAELAGTATHASLADGGQRGILMSEGDEVRVVRDGQARLLGSADGLAVGTVMAITAHGDDVWIGGSSGLALWRGGPVLTLQVQGGVPLRGVSGIVETADGDLWLNQFSGIVHIAAGELRQALSDPSHVPAAESLDRLDGLIGSGPSAYPTPSLVEARDGRLWATTYSGVFWLDPGQRYLNAQVPSVAIAGLDAAGRAVDPSGRPQLDAGTRRLRFDFTSPSLVIPERVRFRYRLSGVDDDWRFTSARSAAYTNLGPGTYTFSVSAANDSGLWSASATSLEVIIPPLVWQTGWFHGLCAVALVGVLWLLHRWRLGRHARRVLERTEVRLAERERIARDLHDTLLQGIQALGWKLQTLIGQMTQTDRLRAPMESALDVARDLVEDGRESVLGLRAPRARQELSGAIAAFAGQFALGDSSVLSCTHAGLPCTLKDDAWLVLLRIGCEACSNALRHAGASRVDVHVDYGEALVVLTVRDDGVGFVVPDVAGPPPARHWGLVGMRERAARLGASLRIDSVPGAGSTVRLECSRARACAAPASVRTWRRRAVA